MTRLELWQLCVAEAAKRVARTRDEFPGCEGATGFDVGGGESEGSSKFERKGTSTTQRKNQLSSTLSSDIQQSMTGGKIPTAVTSAENAWLTNLLGNLDDKSHAGTSLLSAIMALVAGDYTGSSSLANIMERNPYSVDYENATQALYNRSFNQARAAAQSGPANVRGGQARQGFELADLGTQQSMNRFKEIRGQQDKEAGIVMNAVQMANMIEQLRRGTQMQAVQTDEGVLASRRASKLGGVQATTQKRGVHATDLNMAAQVLGIPTATTTDNLSGKGNQASSASNWGVGLTCCFIFLEALNGRLPEFVRLGRDSFNTPNRRNGYKWMSTWLVPMMRQSAVVLWLVNFFMIRPFLYQGHAFYVEKRHTVFKPLCYGWFYLWSFLGWIGLKGNDGVILDRFVGESR